MLPWVTRCLGAFNSKTIVNPSISTNNIVETDTHQTVQVTPSHEIKNSYTNTSHGLKPAKTVLALTVLGTFGLMGYSIFNDPQEINGTITRPQPQNVANLAGISPADWTDYGRTPEGTRYSPLTQINDKNVKDLKVAWTLRTGDFKGDNDSGETTNEVTPIKVGDTMYLCTAHQYLLAVNPSTGQEKWRFDPKLKADKTFQHLTCRGVSYYDGENTAKNATSLANKASPVSSICPRKVILPVNDGRIIAVNADTGQKCSDFGTDGEIKDRKSVV